MDSEVNRDVTLCVLHKYQAMMSKWIKIIMTRRKEQPEATVDVSHNDLV